jgi:NAD-dependent DNA ligase
LSDDIYDMAEDHLRKIAPHHPFLQSVGAPDDGDKVKLPYWMGSLEKIKDDGAKAIQKFIKTYPGSYIVSHKLDGNSGMLVYKSEAAPELYSRGDGKEGQDLTSMLQFITIPAGANGLAVRGELIISKKNWDAISDKGANARNVVAGAMHAKKPDPNIARRIDFVAYELLHPKMAYGDGLAHLKTLGFNVVWNKKITSAADLSVDALSDILVRERDASPYEIDGIVIMHDAEHKTISGKNPKYAFAFKSIVTQNEAEVVVSGVEWRISKDGYIKPTVVFPGVTLAGALIQRATGNNAAFIHNNNIGVGAHIVIIRSGDVIPKVIRVIKPAPMGPMMPDIPFGWNDSHVDIMVTEDAITSEQKIRNLEHFAKTLSIKSVAAGTLTKLVNAGYDDIKALFNLTVEDVMAIDGFQRTSAGNIVTALQKAKREAKCVEMMVASNVFGRGLGEKKMVIITEAFPQILAGTAPTLEALKSIDGIGEATAKSFLAGLSKFFAFMSDIGIPCRTVKAQAQVASPTQKTAHAPAYSFANQIIVFTGFRNKDLEKQIEAAGGKVSSAISGKTTLVVASNPQETSTKLNKARELNIRIMSTDDFIKLVS